MLTAIPEDFGSGGSGLTPGGSSGSPSLRDFLEEHRAAIAALQGEESDELNVRFATTAPIVLASTGLTAIDGVTPLAGDLALVKDQGTAAQNGIYVVKATAWTRLLDAAGNSVLEEGMLVSVAEGTTNKGKLFNLESNLTTWNSATSASLSSATPSPVAAAGSAGSSGNASKADHAHADPNRAAAGVALGDADAPLVMAGGTWRKIPAATLGADRTYTLGTAGAVAGDQIEVTRLDTTAHQAIFVNGGAGAGTLFTMAVSKVGCAKFQFDGTNWALRSFGVQ